MLHVILWDGSHEAVKTIQVFKSFCPVSQKTHIPCPAFVFNTAGATPRILCPARGSPVKERHGRTWISPTKGHEDGEGTEASLLYGKAE